LGQASVAGFAEATTEGAVGEEREGARELFERDRELTEDAEVDFIASTVG